MNIIRKLTLRHMLLNKKRTLVTIIGVIISTAMITAVATSASSIIDLMQRRSISQTGEWHVNYMEVPVQNIKLITEDENTKNYILNSDIGYAKLEGGVNEDKPFIHVDAYNEEGFDKFNYELISGKFPHTENELVISEHIETNAKVKYNIGDKIKLNIGQRYSIEDNSIRDQSYSYFKDDEVFKPEIEKEYTITGIIKRPSLERYWAAGYTAISYIDENKLDEKDSVNVYVNLKSVNNKIYDRASEIAEVAGLKKYKNYDGEEEYTIQFNKNLLQYYGITQNIELNMTLYTLAAIVIVIIIVGSVSLIYNAFVISLSDRKRHLGMLASIGATKSQKMKSVFFEGTVIGIISIPIGILAGSIGMGITFMLTDTMFKNVTGLTESLILVVSPISIIVSVVFSVVTIFISTWIPARRAAKISPIDAIRQTQDIKLKNKDVKTSWITRKIFGFEAELGLKNLKRNKGRYRAAVFSLIISIVLFLTVSSVTMFLKKSFFSSQENVNYDLSISAPPSEEEIRDELYRQIIDLDKVTDYYIKTLNYSYYMKIPKEMAGDYIKENYSLDTNKSNNLSNDENKGNSYQVFTHVAVLDDKAISKCAEQAGIDVNLLYDKENISGIIINQSNIRENGKYIVSDISKYKTGDNLTLVYDDTTTGDVKIAGVIDESEYFNSFNYNIMVVIMSEEVASTFAKNMGVDINLAPIVYVKTEDSYGLESDISEVMSKLGKDIDINDVYINNMAKNRQEYEQLILLISIFSYGFIVLITAICIANIFNTISTSVSLRKREFAMLKSVGMTPKGFNKMINYESFFYGTKALIYGLPISVLIIYLIYIILGNSFEFPFELPMLEIIYAIVAVFIVVGITMIYTSSKIKKENIIDALKQDNI